MINRRCAISGPTTVCVSTLKVNSREDFSNKSSPLGNLEVAQVVTSFVLSSKLTEYRCISHASFTQVIFRNMDICLIITHLEQTVLPYREVQLLVKDSGGETSLLQPGVQKMYKTFNFTQLLNT